MMAISLLPKHGGEINLRQFIIFERLAPGVKFDPG